MPDYTKKPKLRQDLTGRKVGWLVVEGYAGRRVYDNGVWINVWNCVCDCGQRCQRVQRALVEGSDLTSCGCQRTAVQQRRENYGFGSVNSLMTGHKIRAAKAGREFTLDVETFRNLTKQNCYYCGVEPRQVITNGRCKPYTYNGLDRIDSNKGYTPDNVRPCCGTCNTAKSDLSEDEFFEWIGRVVRMRRYETERD